MNDHAVNITEFLLLLPSFDDVCRTYVFSGHNMARDAESVTVLLGLYSGVTQVFPPPTKNYLIWHVVYISNATQLH